jgi:magnesium transporter
MAKLRKRKQKQRVRVRKDELKMLPGAEPGFYTITGEEECPLLNVYSYSPETCTENSFTSTDSLFKYLDENKDLKHWINIAGISNKSFYDNMATHFGLHALQMEDVVSRYQRPKVEEYETHLFIISRMKYTNKDGVFIDEQISLFVFDDKILTFQDYEEDCLDPVRNRLKKANTRVRNKPTFFLAYSIQDAIIDNYFPVINDLATRLEELEEEVIVNPDKEIVFELQNIKRRLIDLRKTIWPEKDKMNELIRSKYKMVLPEYEIYLHDTYDHSVQVMDLIESNREITHSIMDLYMNTVNNKLSEVMKVLTVISSVFIPLTFIAGVYGMNFAATDKNGNALPWSMPELYQPNAYLIVLGIMLLIAIVQIVFFKRKKWL